MITFVALPTDQVRAYQAGGPDAYGASPEHDISDGAGNPCRHCLKEIPKGAGMLILAHRPFATLHPYAETGPIFLCADRCKQGGGDLRPEVLGSAPDYLIKGYDARDRIVYGTGGVVESKALNARAGIIFGNRQVAYIHVRSARNNCYQARIDRR